MNQLVQNITTAIGNISHRSWLIFLAVSLVGCFIVYLFSGQLINRFQKYSNQLTAVQQIQQTAPQPTQPVATSASNQVILDFNGPIGMLLFIPETLEGKRGKWLIVEEIQGKIKHQIKVLNRTPYETLLDPYLFIAVSIPGYDQPIRLNQYGETHVELKEDGRVKFQAIYFNRIPKASLFATISTTGTPGPGPLFIKYKFAGTGNPDKTPKYVDFDAESLLVPDQDYISKNLKGLVPPTEYWKKNPKAKQYITDTINQTKELETTIIKETPCNAKSFYDKMFNRSFHE